MSVTAPHFRNPGPTWGYAFLANVQRILPRWLRYLTFALGTWIAVACMPVQRAHSLAFFSMVFGRPGRWRDVWRHFFTYLEFLLLRLRVASGGAAKCTLDREHAEVFESLMRSGEPALFGTFHFGHSDLLGFLLAHHGRRVAMVRLRVANSGDTEMLERQFRDAVKFIWVNDPDNLLFAMKDAIERGDSLAMQCDRLFSSRTEAFEFFGGRRLFPFAIYHLAVLFARPVMFCIGLPDNAGGTQVMASPLFRADPALSRAENLARAWEHFQGVLIRLEALVRQHPYHWFNFLPMNPLAPATPAQTLESAALPRGAA
jgi:predicted LPLAT superfamily acyltransferase